MPSKSLAARSRTDQFRQRLRSVRCYSPTPHRKSIRVASTVRTSTRRNAANRTGCRPRIRRTSLCLRSPPHPPRCLLRTCHLCSPSARCMTRRWASSAGKRNRRSAPFRNGCSRRTERTRPCLRSPTDAAPCCKRPRSTGCTHPHRCRRRCNPRNLRRDQLPLDPSRTLRCCRKSRTFLRKRTCNKHCSHKTQSRILTRRSMLPPRHGGQRLPLRMLRHRERPRCHRVTHRPQRCRRVRPNPRRWHLCSPPASPRPRRWLRRWSRQHRSW